MSGVLFEDIFEVNRLNPDGKKFDRDINCEIYKVKEADRLTLMLASTLDISGKPDDGTYRPLGDEVTLADKFEYVMHGRIFKCEHAGDNKVQILASFGGLLLRLTGDQRHVANIQVDSRVYLLLRQNQ